MNGFRHALKNTFGLRGHNGATAYDFLPPEPVARPRPAAANTAQRDVVDVHFVTLPARPKRKFSNDNRRMTPAPSLISGIRGAIKSAELALRRLSNDVYSALVAAVSVGVFVVFGGFSVIPGIVSPAADLPLTLAHVSITPQDSGGMQILLINGIVENRSGNAKSLPPIRADIFADGRLIASTLITPPAAEIGADHSRGFSAKLRHPGGKNPDVRLSFIDAGVSRS